MAEFAQILAAAAKWLWPAITIVVLFIFRKEISSIIRAGAQKLRESHEFSIGSFSFKGVPIPNGIAASDFKSVDVIVSAATKDVLSVRSDIYKNQRGVMLVHRSRRDPSGQSDEGINYYQFNIYIHFHKNSGKINDIRSVSYYFGEMWGDAPFGSIFTVENGNEKFGVCISAYGPFLCVADVKFHDGKEIRISRYIDFEMVPSADHQSEGDSKKGKPP